ncbi:MAG: hypothetical protein H6839_11265 [Planctomycetes bacterium]|nr:hypothetical protein [Planctomycetota bacterium]
MKAVRLLALPIVASALVFAGAQDTAKPPFEWKVSGDTVETFKLEFNAIKAIDQSSPKALVETWGAYTDNRQSTSKSMDAVGEKWDAALEKSLRAYESKLLADEFLKRRDADKAGEEKGEVTYSSTRGEEKVTGESIDEVGATLVETTQSVKVRQKDWKTDEWKETTEESKTRYTCIKGEDGKWRINRIEQQRKQVDMDGNVKMTWKEQGTMLDFMLFYRRQYENRKALPALKQDTPEGAALSLFENLIPTREELGNSIHSKGLKAWTDLLEGLFTKSYMKGLDKKFEEWAGNDPEKAKREIETTGDGEDGAKNVLFKKQDEWSSALEVRVKKFDGVWKIVDAGYWQDKLGENGEVTKEFVSETDVYSLKWR